MAETAAGSVWNANNWHWEEKNYTKWARARLETILTNFTWTSSPQTSTATAPSPSSICFKISQPSVTHGDAAVSVRKGKRICSFDFGIKASWSAKDSASNDSIEGAVSIPSFDNDALEDDFEIRVTTAASSDFATSMRRVIQKLVIPKIREVLRNDFVKPLMEAESEKVEEIAKRKAGELKMAEEAAAATGAQKEALLAAAKAADNDRRLAAKTSEAKSSDATEGPSSIAPSPQAAGAASVWNCNSYHWEERNLTKWALEELTSRLTQIREDGTLIPFLGTEGSLSLFDLKIGGEASSSIRKGNRLLVFDLSAAGNWKATTRKEDGTFLADAKGTFSVTGLNSEDLDDLDIEIRCDDTTHPARNRIFNAVNAEGKDSLKEILNRFVADMRSR